MNYEVFDVKMEERPEGITADMAGFWGDFVLDLVERLQPLGDV